MSDSYPTTVREFLQQDEWWPNAEGWVLIGNMNRTYRRRCAQSLLRRARYYGVWDLEEDAGSNEARDFVGIMNAPAKFMRRQPLYDRLIRNHDGVIDADPEVFERYEEDD